MPKKVRPKFRILAKVVAERYRLSKAELLSDNKKYDFSRPRAVLCYIAVRQFKFGLSQLGMMMDKDHTTILHSVRMATRLGLVNKKLVQEIVRETIERGEAEAAFLKADVRRYLDERQSV